MLAAYQVQVSHRDKHVWRNIALCFETKIQLTEQERGIELEYQVFAINKAGEGLPSNAVAALL